MQDSDHAMVRIEVVRGIEGLALRVRQAREQRGLTLEAVAAACGLHPKDVHSIEKAFPSRHLTKVILVLAELGLMQDAKIFHPLEDPSPPT